MRVRVSITVEVDPEEWLAEYGVERAELREDVNTYVRCMIEDCEAPMTVAPPRRGRQSTTKGRGEA